MKCLGGNLENFSTPTPTTETETLRRSAVFKMGCLEQTYKYPNGLRTAYLQWESSTINPNYATTSTPSQRFGLTPAVAAPAPDALLLPPLARWKTSMCRVNRLPTA